MINLILLAPPAAGKGTQAAMISGNYHIPHISTGDLLRASVKNKDEFSSQIEEVLSAGNLVSDDIVYALLKKRIMCDDCKDGFILDGFPRNLDQAEHYINILNEMKLNHGIVILIDVDYEVASSRITGRLVCPKCGLTFNYKIDSLKPKKDNICDKCNSQLVRRSDDNIDTYKVRYDNYIEKTAPLIEYYQNKDMLYRVDGNQSSEDIYKQIEKIIDNCTVE